MSGGKEITEMVSPMMRHMCNSSNQVIKVDENNNPIKMIETGTDGLGDLTCTIFTNEGYDTVRDVSTVQIGNTIYWTTTASDGRTWNHMGTVFATAEASQPLIIGGFIKI